MEITETTYPKLQAKMAAVKKSRIDFEMRIELSPVIPAVKEPYIPVPLAQNKTIIVTNCVKNSSSLNSELFLKTLAIGFLHQSCCFLNPIP